LRLGKVVLFFDAFDEMADRVNWEVTCSNFRELRNATAQWHGKILITCRTHYFKDRNEEARIIGRGPSLTEIDADLLREIRGQHDVEVVYLREFGEDQIRAYLRRVRPATAEADWRTLVETHELDDLAKRPLLLELIVRFIDKLAGRHITTANLYTVCIEHWVRREGEDKQRTLLDGETRRKLMIELAWRLWQDERDTINYRELLPFIQALSPDRSISSTTNSARPLRTRCRPPPFSSATPAASSVSCTAPSASISSRAGSTIRSPAIAPTGRPWPPGGSTGRSSASSPCWTSEYAIAGPLRDILTDPYQSRVSENALQVLYWAERVRSGMEDRIHDLDALRARLAARLPAGMWLGGARLQEIVLEGAAFIGADLSAADLAKANINSRDLRRHAAGQVPAHRSTGRGIVGHARRLSRG
jgi:hypothetical protein